MAVAKLLNLLALSCLAILASYGPAPVAALSVNSHQLHARHAHAASLVKKRASTSKRCKPRQSSSIVAAAAQTTSKAPATTAAPKPAPAKPSPESKPAPNTSSSNSGSGSSGGGGAGKAGIAWALGNDKSIQVFKGPKVDWYYTWSPWRSGEADQAGFNFCPMFWGEKQTNDFKNLVKAGYANCVLGFNEPNQSGQAEMTPNRAADLWRQYIDPLANEGYTTVSPACTNAPSGKTWMRDFFNACQGCRINAMAIHFYGTDPQEMIKYIQDMHETFGMDIWVTEYACQDFSGKNQQCDQGKVFDFMNTVNDWMDSTGYVKAYAAFGAMHDMANVNPTNQLLAPNNQLTALGRFYIGL
jgi:hypothetical protein